MCSICELQTQRLLWRDRTANLLCWRMLSEIRNTHVLVHSSVFIIITLFLTRVPLPPTPHPIPSHPLTLPHSLGSPATLPHIPPSLAHHTHSQCSEPIPSRSDLGLELSYNPLRINSRLSDHISPFSHDTMPREPPPYILPPPLFESDNRFRSHSTSHLPTLFEMKQTALERDESEWYLKVGTEYICT